MKKLFAIVIVSVFSLLNSYCEDKIPNAVGEVFIPRQHKKKWTFKALSPKSRIECQYSIPGALALRCFDKDSAGSFIASLKLNGVKNCKNFNTFIFSCSATGNLKLKIDLDTDAGKQSGKWTEIETKDPNKAKWIKAEVPVLLHGINEIRQVSIHIQFKTKGRNGGFLFVGPMFLRNKDDYEAYKRYWDYFGDLKWEGLLKDESYTPSYKLQCELFFTQKDLEQYRRDYAKQLHDSATQALTYPAPENAISPSPPVTFRPLLVDERYKKVFKTKVTSLMEDYGIFSACLGIVCKDKKLMRLAARYLLSCAAQGDWNDAFWRRQVGGRGGPVFWAARHVRKMAFMYDCVGEYLTPQGRDYVLKEMAYKGLALLNQSLWYYAPFGLNQGMVFLRGKLCALALFDKYWKRVKPYINICKAEADESMDMIFCSDGGYVESTGYFNYAMAQAVDFYSIYSNITKRKLSEVLPNNLKASSAFADVITSTMKKKGRAVVSFGHSYDWFNFKPQVVAFMATAVPESSWGILYKKLDQATKNKTLANYSMGQGITFLGLDQLAAQTRVGKLNPFVLLKSVGLTASNREGKDGMTKIAVFGTQQKCLKRDYDIGQFILEFAGDSFAMNIPARGNLGSLYADSQFRNLLVAIKKDDSFACQIYYYKVRKRDRFCPVATGDEKCFKSTLDLSGAWENKYFKKHVRTIDSPDPNSVMITDDYEVGQEAKGAAFMLQTYLPAEIKSGKVVITGEYGGQAEISFPEYCKAEVEELSLPAKMLKGMVLDANHKCSRIIIRNPKPIDKMQTIIKLSSTNAKNIK